MLPEVNFPNLKFVNEPESLRVRNRAFKLISAYDVISSHSIAVIQWPVCRNTSCCSLGLTQNL